MKTKFFRAALFAFCTASVFSASAATDALLITSPAEGEHFIAGSIINVVVNVPPAFRSAGIIVGSSIPGNRLNVLTAPPYQLQLTVPPETPPGPFTISILAGEGAQRENKSRGAIVKSEPRQIFIDPAGAFTKLRLDFPIIIFKYRGQTNTFLSVEAVRGDGTSVNITHMPQLICESTDKSKVVVNGCSNITATGRGVVPINISFGSLRSTITAKVTGTIVGDFDGSGFIDARDVDTLNSAIGSPAQPTGDDRDLNNDGKIDGKDVSILRSLCNKPSCSW